MLPWYYWVGKKSSTDLLLNVLKKSWELFFSDPLFFSPIFVLQRFVPCNPLFPQLCSWGSSAFTSCSTACLRPACKLQQGRHQLGLSGLGSVWPGATVISGADCGGCGSNHPHLTHHQSPLNIDLMDFLTFESNLVHSNVPILPSLCPSPLRLFFFWLLFPSSFLLLLVFPLSLVIRMYDKRWFPPENAGDLSRLSLLFEWKQWTLALVDLAALRTLSKDSHTQKKPTSADALFQIKCRKITEESRNHSIRFDKCVYRKYSVELFPGDPEVTYFKVGGSWGHFLFVFQLF